MEFRQATAIFSPAKVFCEATRVPVFRIVQHDAPLVVAAYVIQTFKHLVNLTHLTAIPATPDGGSYTKPNK